MRHSDAPNGSDTAFWQRLFALPTLSREEETRLARAWRDRGCKRSLDRLILAHARMARQAAAKFRGYGIPEKELAQAGLLGLTIAAHRFDPEIGVRFMTYSRQWVIETIRDTIVDQYATVRLSERDMRLGLFAIGERKEGRDTAVAALGTIPLDAPSDENGDGGGDERFPSDTPSPEDIVLDADEAAYRQTWLQQALAELPEFERTVVTERMLTEAPISAASLAAKLNLTRDAIRAAEARALRALARSFGDAKVPVASHDIPVEKGVSRRKRNAA